MTVLEIRGYVFCFPELVGAEGARRLGVLREKIRDVIDRDDSISKKLWQAAETHNIIFVRYKKDIAIPPEGDREKGVPESKWQKYAVYVMEFPVDLVIAYDEIQDCEQTMQQTWHPHLFVPLLLGGG